MSLSNEIQHLITRLGPIFRRWHIERAILFGSLARGDESRHSDLDLLLVKNTSAHWFDRYEGILQEIAQAVPGRDVDLLIYTPDELERIADRPLIATALREGIVIYESEQEHRTG